MFDDAAAADVADERVISSRLDRFYERKTDRRRSCKELVETGSSSRRSGESLLAARYNNARSDCDPFDRPMIQLLSRRLLLLFACVTRSLAASNSRIQYGCLHLSLAPICLDRSTTSQLNEINTVSSRVRKLSQQKFEILNRLR